MFNKPYIGGEPTDADTINLALCDKTEALLDMLIPDPQNRSRLVSDKISHIKEDSALRGYNSRNWEVVRVTPDVLAQAEGYAEAALAYMAHYIEVMPQEARLRIMADALVRQQELAVALAEFKKLKTREQDGWVAEMRRAYRKCCDRDAHAVAVQLEASQVRIPEAKTISAASFLSCVKNRMPQKMEAMPEVVPPQSSGTSHNYGVK